MFSTHYLTALLEPRSIAVIGASSKAQSVGHIIFRNILSDGFKGKLWAVNPKHCEIQGQPSMPSIDKIDDRVELAIITTAPRTIPLLVEQCGRAGIKHAIIVTNLAGVGENAATLERRVLDAARTFGVRLLGS